MAQQVVILENTSGSVVAINKEDDTIIAKVPCMTMLLSQYFTLVNNKKTSNNKVKPDVVFTSQLNQLSLNINETEDK